MIFMAIFFSVLFLISCTSNTEIDNESSLQKKLGFCPTMEVYARAYAGMNNLDPIFLGTTSEVLEQLRFGNIDVAIVGRKAWNAEVGRNIIDEQLQTGYTLITNEQRLIQENELSDFVIHTYLDSDIAEILLQGLDIIYHESFEVAVSQGTSGFPNAALIDWSDYTDGLPLLIPMRGSNKVPEFRTPFLYTKR